MKQFTWLMLSLGLLAGSVIAQAQTALPRSKTILVHGVATEELEPEKAELLLTYRASDNVKDADRARNQQAQLLAVLREFNIAPEKLMVSNLTAYGYGGFSRVGNSTVALTKQYKLVVEKPAILDELIPKLVQSGADNVVVSTLESSRLEAFRLEVISKALADARTKAQHIARQVGTPLGKVSSVIELPQAGLAPGDDSKFEEQDKYRAGYSAQGESGVNLRKIRVTVAFKVEYELP